MVIVIYLLHTACKSKNKLIETNGSNENRTLVSAPDSIKVKIMKFELQRKVIESKLSNSYYGRPTTRTVDIKYNSKFFDWVNVKDNDTLVATFRCKNKIIAMPKLVTYYSNGSIESSIELKDTVNGGYGFQTTFYDYFKSVQHGKSVYYWPNGQMFNLSFYKNGRCDSFSCNWNAKGVLMEYTHLDTTVYFNESGIKTTKNYLKDFDGHKYFAEIEFWPNGKKKSEKYYRSNMRKIPSLTWKDYNENGKLIKSVTHSHILPPEFQFEDVTTTLNVERYVCESTELAEKELTNFFLKNRNSDAHGGHYWLEIEVKGYEVSIKKSNGNLSTELQQFIVNSFIRWIECDSSNYWMYRSRSRLITDLYIIEFQTES